MELEGFGASLVGRALFVCSNASDVWIPWEFISDTNYSCKILISSDKSSAHCLEIEGSWTLIAFPKTAMDWSCIATMIKGMGGSILLVFDVDSPRAPDAFANFLEAIVREGRIVLTRIWTGMNADIPTIPDAIFFPVNINNESRKQIYDLISRLPSRNGHREWKQMPIAEWNAMLNTTIQSNLGLVVSDVGETEWTIFWHKIADSSLVGDITLFQLGMKWLKSAIMVIEKCSK